MLRILCLLASIAASAVAMAEEIPIKAFVKQGDILSALLSPGGEYLAIRMYAGERIGIGVIDLQSMKLTGAMSFYDGDLPGDYWWVGPQRLLAEVQQSDGPLDQPVNYGELYAMNADGSKKEYVFGYRGDRGRIGTRLPGSKAKAESAWAFMIDPLPRDPLHALVAVLPWSNQIEYRFPHIDLMDVMTGKRQRISQAPLLESQIIADYSGQPRVAFGANLKGITELRYRKPADKDWVLIQHPGGTPEWLDLHGVDAKGEAAYLSSADGAGPTCLRELRFETQAISVVACNDSVEPDPILAPGDRRPVAVEYEDGRPQLVYPDPQHPDARLLRSLEKSFAGQRVSNISYTLDGNRMVVLVSSDRSPGDYYLVNRAAKKVDYLMPRNKWIDPAAMTPVEPIRVQTRDGATVHGYLTARGGLQARSMPMVVLPHGGPHGVRDYWQWDPETQLLASRGYAVLQVNFRGSGGYGAAFQKAGYRHWDTRIQDDITDAAKWAIAQGIADPARICIYGGSFGAYSALMSAAREPDLYRCAAGIAGVYDLEDLVDEVKLTGHWLSRQSLEKFVGTDAKALREASPAAHAAKVKAAVLLAHGTFDARAPFRQAKTMRDALEKGGNAPEWLEFPAEGHGLYKEENREHFYAALLAFFDKHIGAEAKARAAH